MRWEKREPRENHYDFEQSRVEDAGELPPGELFRAKVPGGWLVLYVRMAFVQSSAFRSPESMASGNGVTFVPDPLYQWKWDEPNGMVESD